MAQAKKTVGGHKREVDSKSFTSERRNRADKGTEGTDPVENTHDEATSKRSNRADNGTDEMDKGSLLHTQCEQREKGQYHDKWKYRKKQEMAENTHDSKSSTK